MKWLVTDIDGTITDESGALHPPALAVLRSLEASGVRVGLITGRPYAGLRLLGEYLGVTGPLIAENGGIGVVDGEEFMIGSKRIAEHALAVLSRFLPMKPTWDNRFRATDVAVHRTVDESEVRRILQEEGLDVEVQVSSIMIHFASPGANKRAGLEHVLALRRMHAGDVVVAGDSDSDLSLFEGFSQSIAPSNCTPGIRALALFCATRPNGEGFCEGMERLRAQGVFA